jgi:hypothetical protein
MCDSGGGKTAIDYGEQLTPNPPTQVVGGSGWDAQAAAMVGDEQGLSTAAVGTAADDVVIGTAEAVAPEVANNPVGAVAIGGLAAGYAIGTAGRWLVGQLFGGGSSGSPPSPCNGLYPCSPINTRWVWVAAGSALCNPGCDAGQGETNHPAEYLATWDGYSGGAPGQTWYRTGNGIGSTTCADTGWRPAMSGSAVALTAGVGCANSPGAVSVASMAALHTHSSPLTIVSSAPNGYPTGGPTAASRTDIANALGNAITKHSNLGKWLQHELDPRCHANPTASTVAVPTPLDADTATSYAQCLQTLGLNSTVQTLTESNLDYGAGAIVDTDPVETTQVQPATDIKVAANPSPATAWEDPRCAPANTGARGTDPGAAPPGYTGSDPRFQPRPAPAAPSYPGFDFTQQPPAPIPINLFWGYQWPGIRRGWGYRHIAILHGYGAGDEANTALALASDQLPTRKSPTAFTFHYRYTNTDLQGSIKCMRSVGVEYQKLDTESAAKHIITSFYGTDPG